MKKGIQLVALLLTVVMSSCTGGKDKAAVKQEDEKPRVKVADVTARPVDQIQDYTATVEAEVKNNIAPSSTCPHRPDSGRSGRPCIQRPEAGADGCSQPHTDETATGQSEN